MHGVDKARFDDVLTHDQHVEQLRFHHSMETEGLRRHGKREEPASATSVFVGDIDMATLEDNSIEMPIASLGSAMEDNNIK